jgi:aminoglycoside phosphotransferase (APT) family kinase protein
MTGPRFIPHDAQLPGLAGLFPPTGAPEFVVPAVKQLTGVAVDAAAAKVSYVRYWPGRRCVVQWTFPAGPQDLIISARLRPAGKAMRREAYPGQLYLEERSLLLQAFPHDDTLPGIERAVSREWMETTLAPALGLSAGEIATLRATATSYKPWRRCVIIYEWRAGGKTRRCYGKLFRDDRGAALYDRLRALDEQLQLGGLPWAIAKPVLYDAGIHMLVQDEIADGACLADVAKTAPEDFAQRDALLGTLVQAATGLPLFQELPVLGLATVGPDDLLEDLTRDLLVIERVDAELAGELGARVARLREIARSLQPEPQGLTHNAFRLSHVFRTPKGMALIDLDALAIGGVSADAGYFLAYLAVTAAHRRRLRGVLARSASEFWEALKTSRYDPRWVGFYAQMALLKWTVRSFYSLDPGWTDNVYDYMKLGRRMIAGLDASVEAGDALLRFGSSRRFLEHIVLEQIAPLFWPSARYADLADADIIYEPGRECVSLAEIEVGDEAAPAHTQRVVITFPAPSDTKTPEPAAAARATFASVHGPYLAEQYPQDYRLPGLAVAHQPEYVARLLAGSRELQLGGQVATALLRYRPHERAVLRWDCADGRRYVAKVFGSAEDAIEVWNALRSIRPQLSDSSRVVRPVALDREGAVVVMEFIEGRTLGDLMDQTSDTVAMERYTAIAAGVLAEVHAVDYHHKAVKTYPSEVKRLRRTVAKLAGQAPEFAREAEALLDRAAIIAERIGPLKEPSIVHGGYKPTQLIVRVERATLVDFDGTSLGDPGIDVGRFMAKLRSDAFDRPRRHLSQLPERFFEQYSTLSRRDVSRSPLFEVNSLLRMAMRRFQTKPELLLDDDTTAAWRLLREARACLERI